jgi:AmpD protein
MNDADEALHCELDAADGWCRGARILRSPNCDARPAGVAVDLLVIHAISLPPGEFGGPYIDALFLDRLDCAAHPYFAGLAGLRVSTHFLVDRAGRITQYVSTLERAWHAGMSRFEGRERCNDFSIGIELEGTDDTSFTARQYAGLVVLTRAVRTAHPRITPARIVGHSDVAPGRKTDPGPHFDWERYRAAIADGC